MENCTFSPDIGASKEIANATREESSKGVFDRLGVDEVESMMEMAELRKTLKVKTELVGM